jgi:exonuclease SbcC
MGLRLGGDAILQGHGEVGEAILGAHTGLHGFRGKVEALDAEAGKLFGDRRGRRAFHEAADRFTQARHDVAERRIEPAAWKQARDDLTTLEQARAEAASRGAALHAERSRLDRIRHTTPARLAVARAQK